MKSIQNQKGAVSLITVILLMFVFLIVTLGFLRLTISEQRQTTDADLNSRAFYAAESGIEDAKRLINYYNNDGLITDSEATRLNGDNCNVATEDGVEGEALKERAILSSELDTEVTCQLIDMAPGEFVKTIGENKSIFVPLIPDDATPSEVTRVRIEWHTVADGVVEPRSSSLSGLPEYSCWNNNEESGCSDGVNYPALLRVGVFSHPESSFSRNNITNKIAYLNPNDGGDGNVNLAQYERPTASANQNVLQTAPKCTSITESSGSDTYACSLEVGGLGNGIKYLRITPLYRGTTVKISMYRNNDDLNNPLKFKNLQAKIDVTAKAGDVIRRVEARIPLTSVDDVLPDEAITTADQLCKLITISGQYIPGASVNSRTASDDCPD